MKIEQLIGKPSRILGEKLSRFEKHFSYPYGSDLRFRIDHGIDYTAFYRSMGTSCTSYFEVNGHIKGIISCSIKEVIVDGRKIRLGYVGDLKVLPEFQGRRTAFYLIKSIQSYLEAHADIAYCVVMDGTDKTPSHYTGRVGIPSMQPLFKRYILRIESDVKFQRQAVHELDIQEGWNLYLNLCKDMEFIESSNVALRSKFDPLWLSERKSGVGMLEDTLNAKRLMIEDGHELLTSHLSYFNYCDEVSGLSVIKQALQTSRNRGFPAMFVSLSEFQFSELQPILSPIQFELATATVFTTSTLPENLTINTSEI